MANGIQARTVSPTHFCAITSLDLRRRYNRHAEWIEAAAAKTMIAFRRAAEAHATLAQVLAWTTATTDEAVRSHLPRDAGRRRGR
jgi:hypothetical protein